MNCGLWLIASGVGAVLLIAAVIVFAGWFGFQLGKRVRQS